MTERTEPTEPTETTGLVPKQERNATGCAACIKKSVSCMMGKELLSTNGACNKVRYYFVLCFLSGQYINKY